MLPGGFSAAGSADETTKKRTTAAKESFTKVRYRSEVPRSREQNARGGCVTKQMGLAGLEPAT
ncbi:MAG: hypothetical protein DLM73_10855, partial [Chthoniobacterales bacterium]